jgi:uncharacterized protein (TIGR02266 family)
MDAKDDLKNIIREHLGSVVSALFLEKSMAIVDESAHNKESFLAAADRICKRIALFINTDLSIKVFDILKIEIENRELTPGTKRRHVRVALHVKIFVICNGNGMLFKLYTGDLSLGGMFIKTTEPFPAGSEVKISFPLEKESRIYLKGVIVYSKSPSADITKRQPGMGIKFTEVGDAERKILMSLARRSGEQSLVGDQAGTVIEPSLANH